MALSGKYGDVYLSSTAAATPFMAASTTANEARTEYQITNPTQRYWDPRTPVDVFENGEPLAPSGYAVAYAGGKIIFQTPREVGSVITVSAGAISCSRFAECHAWTLNIATDMVETPKFQTDWKFYVEGQTGATGSFSKWFTTAAGKWFLTRLTAGTPLLILLFEENTLDSQVRYEVMVYLSGQGVEAMVDGAVDESIEFTVNGPVNYATA